MSNSSFSQKRIFVAFITVVAIIGIASSIFFYIKYQKAQSIINTPAVAGQLEVRDLVKKVSQLMFLPDDETPTVATISDYKKLKDQPFFKNGQNGDKLLIYPKAKTAILYNPKLNKIVTVGPLNIGQTATPVRIALFNGTTTPGLTNTVEQQLKSSLNNVVISGKENAKNSYKKTLVVDLTGNQGKAVSDLAKLLKGEVSKLPDGEVTPVDSDILIILGK